MRTMFVAGCLAVACTALLGIQQAVAVALRQTAGGVTTLIAMGMALLCVWAIAVLRGE